MNKRILYVGGFELPDKNAAAQRVVSNTKILRELGYEILLSGITKSSDFKGVSEGFNYESFTYPKNLINWYSYLVNNNYKTLIEKWNPSIIIAYNLPAIALYKLNNYCKNKDIILIGDLTEWYSSSNLFKIADTAFRMHWVNKKLAGQIVISKYLSNFYSTQSTLLLPPLVDLSQPKWHKNTQSTKKNYIDLVYVGSPGAGRKDRLDLIVDFISKKDNRVMLTVVGITQKQFNKSFKRINTSIKNVKFLGRLSHQESLNILKDSDLQFFIRDYSRQNNAGFPTKFAESISAGIPVITNLTSDLNDFLINGINGFVINSLSNESFEKTLEEVLSCSREQINEMKKNCLESKRFDYRGYISQTKEFFDKIVNKNYNK